MTKSKEKVNAVIMAAGFSSRFAPISYEYPKALLNVKGEVLIERQILQLQEAGISDITVVVGYKKELFHYLKAKFGVQIVQNPVYHERNNHSSLYAVKEKLRNTFICSADNYFTENVFDRTDSHAWYASVYHEGVTEEWCLETNEADRITNICIGGRDCWVMLGHVYFTEQFSNSLIPLLEEAFQSKNKADFLWEDLFKQHLDSLSMYIRKFSDETIYEFDSLEELRAFDKRYEAHTGSVIMESVSKQLNCSEEEITITKPLYENGQPVGFELKNNSGRYTYRYQTGDLAKVESS